MTRRLFHLAPPLAFRLGLESEQSAWEPPSLAAEGFIHLSFADQLRGTLVAHFATANELLLLEIDPAGLGDDLRLERSRADALFPHLYRPLAHAECLRQWVLERRASGWILPALGERAADDFPAGQVL